MKIIFCVLVMSSTAAYSAMSPKDFQKKMDDIYTKQTPRFEGCVWQNKELRKPSYKVLDETIRNDEDVELTIDEAAAMKLLAKYDYKKDFFGASEEYKDVLEKNCSLENLVIYSTLNSSEDLCRYPIEEMQFFRAMIYASKNKNWKLENKNKLKEVILASIKNNVKNDQPIISYLTQLTVLKDMVTYKLIDGKNEKEIISLRKLGEDEHEKIHPRGITHEQLTNCDFVVKQFEKDRKLKKVLNERMAKIL